MPPRKGPPSPEVVGALAAPGTPDDAAVAQAYTPADRLTRLESLACAFADLPDMAVAVWLQPFFLSLAPVSPDVEIPPRVATLAALIGLPLRAPVAPTP